MGKWPLVLLSVWVYCSHGFCSQPVCPTNTRTNNALRPSSPRKTRSSSFWHLQSHLQWLNRRRSSSRQAVSVASSFSPSSPSDEVTKFLPSEREQQPSTTPIEEKKSTLPDSVHLRLNGQSEDEDDEEHDDDGKKKTPDSSTVRVHSYVDPRSKTRWTALNTTKRKFYAYLQYSGIVKRNPRIETEVVTDNKQEGLRLEWRKQWNEHHLVTDRTELLTIYPSESKSSSSSSSSSPVPRGGFKDLLALYTERLMAIWRDEQDEPLMDWLVEHYPSTATLLPNTFGRLKTSEKLASLKSFLEWFRSEFPYFYDRCGTCGASIKEDGTTNQNHVGDDHDDDDEEDSENETFVGYICPNVTEMKGKASRTELYRCHKCGSFTRFPRYNSARYVLDNRRGRCGEYSMLLYRFLRTLGHESRWVVDWADHVWAEIRLDNRWVHLDPCEAAVDEKLLYQAWGKKQTFVLGFCLPSPTRSFKYPIIEDVTQQYTTDARREILNRREESDQQVKSAIEKAAINLRSKLMQRE